MSELRGNSADWSSRVTTINEIQVDYYACGCIHPDPLYVVWVLRYTGKRLPSTLCPKHQERPHAHDAIAEAG